MKLTEQKYHSERPQKEALYQGVTVTLESIDRQYITVELDYMHRWRSTKEVAGYLRWVAKEIETLGGGAQ